MGCGSSIPRETCVACLGKADRSASQYCLDCDKALCATCSEQHQPSAGKPHYIVPLGEFRSGRYDDYQRRRNQDGCKRHVTEYLDLYCLGHGERVCADCRKEDHPQCDVQQCSELKEKWTHEIKRKMRRVEFKHRTLETQRQELSTRLHQLPLQRQSLKDEAQIRREELQQLLVTTATRVERELDARCDQKEEQLNEAQQKCDASASNMGNLHETYKARFKGVTTLPELQEAHKELMAVDTEAEISNIELENALANPKLHQPLVDEEGMEQVFGFVEVDKPSAADIAKMEVPRYASTAGSRISTAYTFD